MPQHNYMTVAGESSDCFIEKKSRFIGYITPVESEAAAQAYIQALRKKHWDASHCVSAYVLKSGQVRRYSDDGEPQGTAGMPTLDVIVREGLVDVCIVVVRYFGGTLLGAGGLVRAYAHTAKLAVDAATRLHMCKTCHLQATVAYTLFGKISNELPKMSVRMESPLFSDTVTLDLRMRAEGAEKVIDFLTEVSGGSATITVLPEEFCNWT